MFPASQPSSSRNVLPTDLPSHVAARLRARQQSNSSSPLKASVPAVGDTVSRKSANEQSVLVDRLAREVRQIETVGRQGARKATISCGCAALDDCLPDNGYAPGSVVEYLRAMPGCGASTLALTAAATAMRSTNGFVVIVDTQHDIYPPALASWGIDLEKVVLVRPQSDTDALWAIDQSLRTPAVAAVVADLQRMDDRAARRLQLAAEQGGGLALLVRPIAARRGPSWADVQWIVRALPSRDVGPTQNATSRIQSVGAEDRRLQVQLVRVRGGKAGATVRLQISAKDGTLHEVKRHEPTGALHLASQLASATSASRRAAAG